MNTKAAFVMPHKLDGSAMREKHFRKAVASVEHQTDKDWILIIVDDYSDNETALSQLRDVKNQLGDRVNIIYSQKNLGTGLARNKAINYAAQIGAPFILYLDADDIAHERRLELTRKVFESNDDVNVVYSSFDVIDEHGDLYKYEHIPLTIREIIDGHQNDIVQGENAWIDIATKKNYTTLTSCTSVRTELALKEPFPATSVSEDVHTWYRYGAHPGKYVFLDSIKNYYRVCSGSESNSRSKNIDFYEQKARVDSQGFEEAVKIYLKFNKASDAKINSIRIGFLVREALCMLRVNETKIANELLWRAVNISNTDTKSAVVNLTAASDSEKRLMLDILSNK